MSEWIEYLNDRSVEPPTEGYVEYEDTWDNSKSYLMDVAMASDDLIWNRAAPRCMKRFRFTTELRYMEAKKNGLTAQHKDATEKLNQLDQWIEETTARIEELTDKGEPNV